MFVKIRNYFAKKYNRKKWKFVTWIFKKVFVYQSSEEELGWLHKLMLRWFARNQSGFRYLEIQSQGALVDHSLTLETCEYYVCEAPREVNQKGQVRKGVSKPVKAKHFRGIVASANSSAILQNDIVYIPQYYHANDRAMINEGDLLLWHSTEGRALVYQSDFHRLDKGINIFGTGAENWYHWLIEFLPMVYLAQRLPKRYQNYPLLVPANNLKVPQFRESLDLFVGNRKVQPLDRGLYLIDDLISIDKIVSEPIFMRPGNTLSINDYAFCPTSLIDYRNAIFDKLGCSNDVSDMSVEKIFLARSNKTRPYNQEELLPIAMQYGFKVVYPEMLTFKEQVQLFSKARFVVGPSGAAFTNSLFCSEGTRLLSWVLPQYSGFCSFMNIVNTIGGELRYIFVEPLKEVQNTADAFRARYCVSTAEFEQALHAMLFSADW